MALDVMVESFFSRGFEFFSITKLCIVFQPFDCQYTIWMNELLKNFKLKHVKSLALQGLKEVV